MIQAVPPKGTWSEIKEDLVLEFVPAKEQLRQTGEPARAWMLSPDFKGERACEMSKSGEGRWLLRIPKDALKRYSILFIGRK